MSAQHWRAIQLYRQRDVLRFVAAVAFVCLLFRNIDSTFQAVAGVGLLFALYFQYRAGTNAREIDELAANLIFETDQAAARERFDSLVIGSRFDYRIWRKPIS